MFDYRDIISWIRKNITRSDVMILLSLVMLYFLTRMINLTHWPIFSDEGIYIRWAKVAWRDASWRFISVTDGRQPLQTWATIPFLKLFWPDALFAGRMFSVAAGFAALSGITSFVWYLWGKKSAYLGAFLYLFLPYFLFYDRIALVDSAVNAGFIWIVFLSIVLARTMRPDIAFALGFIGGIALLAKSSSRLFLLAAATAPLLFTGEKLKTIFHKSLNYFLLLSISVAISLLFYNVQRLSPFFHYVAMKNTTFVLTFSEFLADPFSQISHNIKIIPQYIAWEAGWAIIPVSIAGFVYLYRDDKRLFLYLMMFFIIPFIAIAFFAKVIFPRYLLFNASLLVIGAVYFIRTMERKLLIKPFLLFLFISMLTLDYPLIFNPAKASFPEVDRGQYIEGVTAVWGAENLMATLREKSKEKKVIILAEGNFGLVADVLDVYLQDGDNIEIRGEWPLDEKSLIKTQPDLQSAYVYIVFSHREIFPKEWPMRYVKKYPKPNSDKALYLFELTK